jgi:hypothetical protein
MPETGCVRIGSITAALGGPKFWNRDMQHRTDNPALAGQQTLERGREPPVWVSVKEGMRLSSIKRTRFYELLNDRTLHSIRVGARRLVSYDSIKRLGGEARRP